MEYETLNVSSSTNDGTVEGGTFTKVESTQDTGAPATGEPAPTKEAAPADAGKGTVGTPAYAPNFKYKIMDQEREFDEIFRPLVKDPETEKKIKEFHEKAYGLDVVKADRDRVKEKAKEYETKYKDFESKYSDLDKSLTQLGKFMAQDDLDSFFSSIRLPEEQVFRWVAKKLREMELPPEQRAEIQRQNEYRQRAYYLEQQNQDLETRYQAQQVQARTMELDTTLARPDVQQFVSEFDSRRGTPGSFRKAVIERGATFYKLYGQDLPVEQAVSQVMQEWKPFLTPQQATATPSTPQAATAPAKVPVIPAVQGSGSSPVRKVPRSVADLKQLADSM